MNTRIAKETRPKKPQLKFVYITVLLLALLVTRSALPSLFVTRIFAIVMVASAWLVSGDQRRIRIVLAVLSLPAVGALLLDMLMPSYFDFLFQGLSGLLLILITVLLFIYCGVVLLVSLIRKEHVTADDILGTVSLYIMIGFTWAYLYTLLEILAPGSFLNLGHDVLTVEAERNAVLFSELVYFSFITLATQGYGDITPNTPVAETTVIIETVIGQLYVALVLAYLLSVHITQRMKEK
jgi:hypothetical protein